MFTAESGKRQMTMELKEIYSESVETLRKGGLLLYPTDTVWGLGCDATDP